MAVEAGALDDAVILCLEEVVEEEEEGKPNMNCS